MAKKGDTALSRCLCRDKNDWLTRESAQIDVFDWQKKDKLLSPIR